MKFHTKLGTYVKLSVKELARQFDGLTIAVRPFRHKHADGKKYSHVVSLVETASGNIRGQILAENMEEIGEASAHLMRWLDKCSHDDCIKAASASRDRATRKIDEEKADQNAG